MKNRERVKRKIEGREGKRRKVDQKGKVLQMKREKKKSDTEREREGSQER